MSKRILEAGQRVRVFHRHGSFKGRIDSIASGTNITQAIYVIEDGFYSCHNDAPFHPRQCVRLKSKKAKPRQGRKQLLVEFDKRGKLIHNWGDPVVEKISWSSTDKALFLFKEIRSGEFITSEKDMGEAWANSNTFTQFCRALGARTLREIK